MTRLIDADAISWELVDVGYIPVITKEEIDAMPTVDAIPIDYIKRMAEVMSDATGGSSVDIIDLIIIAWEKRKKREEE